MALWQRLLPVLLLLAATTTTWLAGVHADEYTPFPSPFCSSDNFTAGSTYQFNVYKLVELLGQGATLNGGFFNTSYGFGHDQVFGLLMCYADYSWDKCVRCLDAAVSWVGAGCPYSRSASVNYDRCLIRYSNQPFFGAADQLDLATWVARSYDYTFDADDAARMSDARWALVGNLTEQAAVSPLRFAYNSSSYMDSKSNSLEMYALAQCRWDLVHDECTTCLGYLRDQLVTNIPNDTAGYLLGYCCYIRYNITGPMEIIAQPSHPPAG